MHFRCVLVKCGLCASRFGLGSTHVVFKIFTSRVHAYFMHTLSLLSFLSLCCDVLYSLSLVQIDYAMAPKARKSILAQNPLRGLGSSSSSDPPLHVWFHDKRARKDFLENF